MEMRTLNKVRNSHIISVSVLFLKYTKSDSLRMLLSILFPFWRPPHFASHYKNTTVKQNEGFFLPVFSPTYSQGKSHLYLQPFKFRQVAKSLWLQGFQVVEVQVAVTQKSTRDRFKDHNLKDNHSPHISVFSLGSPTFTCKNSSQHCLLPVLSIVYSLWINCNTHWGDQICSSLKLWKNEAHEEPAAAVPHPTTIQELCLAPNASTPPYTALDHWEEIAILWSTCPQPRNLNISERDHEFSKN